MAARRFDRHRLRRVRRARDLTQSDVAKVVGVSDPAVASWETGHSSPDSEKLPALARVLGQDLDEMFPRAGLPDLADLRCDAGYSQYQTKELTGTKSAGPVANAERGKRRLSEKFVRLLADGYGVTVDALLDAQERSFGHDVRAPETDADGSGQGVPRSLAEKITYLLDHSFPGQTPPSDAEIAESVNTYAGGRVLTERDVEDLRVGNQPEASPLVQEGLAHVFHVDSTYFKPHEAVARQVYEGLRLLRSVRRGAVGRSAARGLGSEGLPADVLAYVNKVVEELEEKGLPPQDGGEK
ncbi:helix-turn-helix domain-containing protein [Streptomyces sp. NPDC021212]|uniref:helix-turn-helix domain-containing protein n=1 Tax=Streptomyces sp. NPDC021212 TaxID=3365118 RepID=UPI00379B1B4A